MKLFVRLLALAFLACIAILFSCQKEVQTSANVNTGGGTSGNGGTGGGKGGSDTCGAPSVLYTGQEFIFDVDWFYGGNFNYFSGDGYDHVPIDPSRFFSIPDMAAQNEEIFIRKDSSSPWIPIPQWKWYPFSSVPVPSGNYYWYFQTYPYCKNKYFTIGGRLNSVGLLDLEPDPFQVKVKFL